jgi:hypothetical protein
MTFIAVLASWCIVYCLLAPLVGSAIRRSQSRGFSYDFQPAGEPVAEVA